MSAMMSPILTMLADSVYLKGSALLGSGMRPILFYVFEMKNRCSMKHDDVHGLNISVVY